MDLNERKLRILQAIIADFIRTGEPVGSRTLSKKYEMGISPATIRNEMSDLEEMGFLTHPHTSAGRVPSDKAYRLYVNSLMQKRELSMEEKRAINNKLHSNISELEKTIQHAASLLSEITNLTSFAMTPDQNEDQLKYINLLAVDEQTVVLMIVSESGKVTNTAIKLRTSYTVESLELLSKSMTYNYRGKSISEVLTHDIIRSFQTDIEAMNLLAENIMPNFMKTLENMLNVNLYMDGLKNIFSIPEYNDIDKAKMFIELLDKKEDFTKKLIKRDNGVIITIGNENADDMMQECSLITATYHIDGKLVGKIGVIGPTRMKYDEVTSVIEYVTENLSNTFKLTGGNDEDD
ncbi:heat-inducible transcriptional repressor HrcA [Clostridium aminobutyricum]|uniref:Heat-inducible transcription repressor HrcA n=1 Tax=Clostridium aminobutyricum TaxID=33953 RepID=A0A939II67_CLOAM|nr:heat-inducible transcriptional repressor HrcA [Clostridium aminobutyricum]MBN7772258.1 heat-inducible transcription repressor HrcA [Clostridium aminobutyricum]